MSVLIVVMTGTTLFFGDNFDRFVMSGEIFPTLRLEVVILFICSTVIMLMQITGEKNVVIPMFLTMVVIIVVRNMIESREIFQLFKVSILDGGILMFYVVALAVNPPIDLVLQLGKKRKSRRK